MEAPWEEVLEQLREIVRQPGASMSAHARRLGLSPAALSRILSGKTTEPQPHTRQRIREYVGERRGGRPRVPDVLRETSPPYVADARDATTPEEELLEYFLAHHEQMAVFLSTTTDGLGPEDRRKVALATLNGFKRLAIEAGKPIPPVIYEIERRFVAE